MIVEGAEEVGVGEKMDKEGFEHVIDGYVQFTYVQFEWHKSLNPWQVKWELSMS